MSGIDNRVVSMEFDNQAFERRLSDTLTSLDKLSESIRLVSAKQGLTDVATAAKSFDVSKMATAVDGISRKFSALGAIGFTVIQDLTRAATDFAQKVSAKVFEPLTFGGAKRATNIENAKFQFRGLGIDVDTAMASALAAVKGTAYGLDEAAKAAAQFGASGIDAGKDMTTALRGIAGAAAMTNTSFAEIADIYTSAAGSGIVNNQDLQRFATRGLNATAALAKQFGVTEEAVKQMAKAGDLNFMKFAQAMDDAFGEHAQKANETYTGSLANMNAAIARIGASWYGARHEQMRDFFNALTPVIDTLNDAFQPLIKTFLLITDYGNKQLIGFLGDLDLTNFSKGIEKISNGIIALFRAFVQLVGIAKDAFRDIFPKSETSGFLAFATAFKNFTEKLKMGGETADKVKSVFKGLFSILAIGGEIVKEVFKLFAGLAGAAFGAGSGGVLDFTADLGDSLTRLKEALVDGGGIERFFEKLGDVIRDPLKYLGMFKDALVELFNGGTIPGTDMMSDAFVRVSQRFEMLASAAEAVGRAWQWLSDRFEGVAHVLGQVWDYITEWFSELGSKLAAVMQPGDFDAVVDVVNVGLLGGLVLIFKKFTGEGFKVVFRTGLIERLRGLWVDLTRTLKVMQTELKVRILLKIAAAIAVLTASMVVLSMIDSVALTKALVAMGVGFGQLVGVMTLLDKIDMTTSSTKIIAISASMILLGTAILVLAVAVKKLSKLSWEELAKGLIGVTVLLGGLTASTKLIAKDTSGMVRAGVAMIGISIALLILSQAVKAFSKLSWGEMAKGLVGVGVGLGIVTTAVNFMPKGMVAKSLGLIGIAIALNILAKAVQSFGGMAWSEMGKGFVGIGAGLLVVAGGMRLMPGNLLFTAAGLLAVSVALTVMAKAVAAMGSIGILELVKGIGAIAAVMIVLAVATTAMSGALSGAAALVVVAGALHILAGVIKELSALSIGELVTGIAAIAAVLAVLGIGAAVLAPLIPVLFTLGAALAVIGGAFALFGIGASLVAKSFEMMAKAGKAGMGAIIEVFKMVVAALPEIATAFATAIADFIKTFLDAAPVLIKGMAVVLGHLLDTIIELSPKIAEALAAIGLAGLQILKDSFPEFVKTGFAMLMSLLQGIRDNIGEITTLAVEILVNFSEAMLENMDTVVTAGITMLLSFLQSVSDHADEITAAGAELLVSFLGGITDNLDQVIGAVAELIIEFVTSVGDHVNDLVDAGFDVLINFLWGIENNLERVVNAVGSIIIEFTTAVGNKIQDIIDAGVDILVKLLFGIEDNLEKIINTVALIVEKFVTALGDKAEEIGGAGLTALLDFLQGIEDDIQRATHKGVSVVLAFLEGLGKNSLRLARGAADVLIDFINGLADAIREKSGELRAAGRNIAGAIIDGATFGLSSRAGEVANAAKNMASGVINAAEGLFHVNSPSKVFIGIGESVAEGLVLAFDRDTSAEKSAYSLADRVTTTFQDSMRKIPDTLSDMDDFNPVVTPVLDLTKVESASKGISRLIDKTAIIAGASFNRAAAISNSTSTQQADEVSSAVTAPSEIKFEQNIYAPKELSVNDIYRNTKSQIALAKEELKIS